ncbi:MAG: AAA family ATPase [Nanoarchaeota archaeon]|nr:AAA family ATPase [Nanoarchaeota archaeon]MBU1644156.1 AAA family ATPase [Nanoarchaeota archaeon]MBU1977042.1 AAA family ATPase [Nanoarchaeota archaeon]
MRVYCTGISGVGASKYIEGVVEYAKTKEEEIKIFNVGKEVFRLAEKAGYPVTPTGVLDLSERALTHLTDTAYENIAGRIEKYENAIIDAHLNFRWRGAIITPVKMRMITPLKPDIYVTIMDLARPIIKRLSEDTKQWKREIEKNNITIPNTLDLQNMEVNLTEQIAHYKRKPMYVLPTGDSPDSLYKIATNKDVEVAYVSFPMTHILTDEVSREKIDNFVKQLRQFENLALITPRAVEVPTNPSSIEEQHTVMQDLGWFVEKSTKRIFVYFPKIVYSRGVDHESIRAKESCKEVWFTAPPEMRDPFTNSTIHKRFNSPEECLEALVKEGLKRTE